MQFIWDLQKSQATLERRGFDFTFATLVFDGWVLERDDKRTDYGERRVLAVGISHGLHLTVVYTDRLGTDGVMRRIISARASSRRERRDYDQAVEEKT
jgi:uncharacterized protein